MSAPTPAPRLTAAGTPYDPRAAVAVLSILAGMAVMVTYVETMVLPAFRQFYVFFDGAPYTTIAWILSAYLLVGTVATPIFGKLGDKYGKKQVLLVVMSVYAVAVSIAGFTPNLGADLGLSRPNQLYLLIGVRAVQGIGMAMFPLAFAMIPETFPGPQVGPAQGLVSAMFATGAAIGLSVGAWVAQTDGWQFTYHTVIPFAVVLVALAAWRLRESPSRHRVPIDFPGIASLAAALAFFLVGITEGTSWGWTNVRALSVGGLVPWGVPEFFGAAAVALAAFVLWEPRSPNPVVSFTALRQRNILVSNIAGLVVGTTMFLTFVALTVLAEDAVAPGFNLSEIHFGLLALPSALGMLGAGPVFGVLSTRWGPKPVMLIGFAVSTLGGLGLTAFHGTPLELELFAIPVLVGVVAVMISMTNVIILSAAPRELGIQTGMNQTFRNLGSAIGPVVATSLVASFTTTIVVAPPPHLQYASVPAAAGFAWVFALIVIVSAVGFLLALALRNFRFRADGTRMQVGAPAPASRPASHEEAPSVTAAPAHGR